LIGLRKDLPNDSKILELGGGAGSFVKLLAQDAQNKSYAHKISQYIFSDIAPAFLRVAQRDLQSQVIGFPLAFKMLNINKNFFGQGIEPNSLDAVIAVNVLHVASDITATLSNVRTILKPGGRFIFGECLKPQLDKPIYIEFFFQFMSSFTNVQVAPPLRPSYGFLECRHWIELLKFSGYTDIQEWPISTNITKLIPTFYTGAFSARSY
jgi:SAM-dependent methyltransferase